MFFEVKNLHAGIDPARGGELFCELAGDRVKIGGNAVTFLKGEIFVEESPQSLPRAQSSY